MRHRGQRGGRGPGVQRRRFRAFDVIEIQFGNQREINSQSASLRRASRLTYCQVVSICSSSTLRSHPPKTGSQYPYRISAASFFAQKVDQPTKGSKPTTLRPVGHKIGKRVDVVKVELSIAIVDDVLDAAYFDVRRLA